MSNPCRCSKGLVCKPRWTRKRACGAGADHACIPVLPTRKRGGVSCRLSHGVPVITSRPPNSTSVLKLVPLLVYDDIHSSGIQVQRQFLSISKLTLTKPFNTLRSLALALPHLLAHERCLNRTKGISIDCLCISIAYLRLSHAFMSSDVSWGRIQRPACS